MKKAIDTAEDGEALEDEERWTIAGYLDLFAGAVGGREAITGELERSTGLDLERDVIAWMGEWSMFVRGASVAELGGALTIESDDEAASSRFLEAVGRLARESEEPGDSVGPLGVPGGGEGFTLRGSDLPQPVHLFQRDGRVVLALGDSPPATRSGPARRWPARTTSPVPSAPSGATTPSRSTWRSSRSFGWPSRRAPRPGRPLTGDPCDGGE